MKTKKGFLTYLLIIGLTVSMFGVLFNIQGVNAQGANWLSGWSYRQSHVIDSAAGAGTDYQIEITAYYGSGTDSGGSVYLNGLCRTDFGDVRFTASDGSTLLNYSMISLASGSNAVFWVQDPDNLSIVDSTIYIYYGNSGATTTSNGANTFDLFENASAYQWVADSADNQVLTPIPGSWDAGGVWPLSCVYVAGTYYLYFSGSTTSADTYTSGEIGVATSTDDIHWTQYAGNPIITTTGSGWECACVCPAVCYVNGVFYMMYSGFESNGVTSAAMLAASTDGFTFTDYSGNPVLNDGASWINHHVECSGLSYFGGTFYFYYNVNSNAEVTRNIGVATSSNCQSWTLYSGNPVVTTNEAGAGYGTGSSACVIMPKVVQWSTLDGSPLYLMTICASSAAVQPSQLHLDCLTCTSPMFNSIHYWNPLPSGSVFAPSSGVDDPAPVQSLDSAGNTVAYGNSLNITYSDGTNGLRATYVVGGSLVPFEGWNRLNEAGTWSATNGYIEDDGRSNALAYLYSNLNTGNLRFVVTLSAPTNDYYEIELVALQSGNNFCMIDCRQYHQGVGNDLRFYKVSGGTYNLLGTFSGIPWSNGDTVEFLVSGVDSGTVTLACLRNGVLIGSETDSSSPYSSGFCGLGAWESNGNGWVSEFSNVYVTNYVNPEPVQGTWGNEQTQSSNLPTVIVSPSSATVDVGQSVTFSASVSGGTSPYTYQWYLNGAPVGTDSASYSYTATTTDLTAGSFTVSVTVTDSASNVVSSNTETVKVNSALVAPTASASKGAVDQGQTSALSSTAVSTGTSPYTYQWLQKAPGGSYVDVGTNSARYSFVTSGSTATGTWSFELQVTDAASAVVTSNSASVKVNSALVAPTVIVSPSSWTMDVGQSKTFTATPSGGSGSYTRYQWYVGGVAQIGATASTFSYSPRSAGSYSITVTVTDSSDVPSPQSSPTTVQVNSAFVAPTASASKGAVDRGQTSSLTSVAASGGTTPYSYQWFEKGPSAGSYSSISGATSSSYSFSTSTSTATGTWSFELQVTDAASAVVTSNSASVKVNAAPTVRVSPSSWTMDVGRSKVFSASASGGSSTYASYQWYVGGVARSGQTASTFSYAPKSAGSYSITVTVTDSLGATSAQSSPASVRVLR